MTKKLSLFIIIYLKLNLVIMAREMGARIPAVPMLQTVVSRAAEEAALHLKLNLLLL